MKKITVIGSMNIDMLVQVDKLPVPGETMQCNAYEILPGGKGMNQAVCAAKLGAAVTMAGCLGEDMYSTFLLDTLRQNNIETKFIKTVKETSTGMAIVTTSNTDNTIVVVPGANSYVDKSYTESLKELITASDLVMLQLEIPLDTVYEIIDFCYENAIKVILNPAPGKAIKPEYIEKVTYCIPNETELKLIFQKPYQEVLKEYPGKIIMSAGKDGAYFHDGEKLVHCKAVPAQVVDTTGAGDAFNGAIAVATLAGKPLEEAVIFANQIAAFTISYKGAQGAMPDIDKLIL